MRPIQCLWFYICAHTCQTLTRSHIIEHAHVMLDLHSILTCEICSYSHRKLVLSMHEADPQDAQVFWPTLMNAKAPHATRSSQHSPEMYYCCSLTSAHACQRKDTSESATMFKLGSLVCVCVCVFARC